MLIARSISLVLSTALALTLPQSWASAAEFASLVNSTDQMQTAAMFQFNPPNDGVPGNTAGGASRSINGCQQQSATQAANITFLSPTTFVGRAVSEHPEFLLYAEQTSAKQIFVSIHDQRGESLYQGFQPISTASGLIKIALPEDAPALDIETIYRISLVPMCGASLRPDDPILTGYIKRVSWPESIDQTAAASAHEQVQKYAEAGIWYDTLIAIDQEIKDSNQDHFFHTAWNTLLTAGGLEAVIHNNHNSDF